VSRLYPDRPFAAALAAVRRGGRVLLAQRSKGPVIGRWGFPGGMQELGETILAAAQRELREETGIEAEPLKVLDVLDRIGHDGEGRVQSHFTLICVLLDWRRGEGEPIEEASALGWFTPEEAQALDKFPDAERLMRMALTR